MKISLHFSTAYHPESDDQTERVNQCMEQYLRCMVFQEPKKWSDCLPAAEFWYTTIITLPFKCLLLKRYTSTLLHSSLNYLPLPPCPQKLKKNWWKKRDDQYPAAKPCQAIENNEKVCRSKENALITSAG
jgi:hypothetical protein